MTERSDLLASIADTIADYRAGEVPAPTPDHVDRWVLQFDEAAQLPILREMTQVLPRAYLSKAYFLESFIPAVIFSKKMVGDDPVHFWLGEEFLDIQLKGRSQSDLISLFRSSVIQHLGLMTERCGDGSHFVYVDDVLFSGDRVSKDLEYWMERHCPDSAVIRILHAVSHNSGRLYLKNHRLPQIAAHLKKKITFECRALTHVENCLPSRDESGVLWPAVIPNDPNVQRFMALPTKYPLQRRTPGGDLGPFSSEAGRQLLESQMLIAGSRILAQVKNPKEILRPLGYGRFGVGFGSMHVTYRNCANNCPLALWWGDPEATQGPLKWYPLFPRATYATVLFDVADPDLSLDDPEGEDGCAF